MIIFWILSAGLIGLAMVFIALPLLRPERPTDAPAQDELNLAVFKERLQELDDDLAAGFLERDQYAAARRDLERDLLHDVEGEAGRARASGGRWIALVLAVAVPAGAVYMYTRIGEYEIIERMEGIAFRGESQQPLVGPDGQALPPLEVLVERLAERLSAEPGNIDGWLMLGRTYFTMGQPQQALEAISRAFLLAPERADVMLAYAEALAASNGNSLEGEPAELIERVLQAEPENESARWLAGMLYYQRGQYTAAATAWQRLLDVLDPASQEAEDMRGMIAEAMSRAGAAPSGPVDAPPVPESPVATTDRAPAGEADVETAPAHTTPGQAASAPPTTADTPVPSTEPAATRAVTADIALDPAMLTAAAPDDPVFVFARAAAGPPMPLAVQRLQVKDLPTSVRLDDSMAMTPAMSLSTFPQVVIGARVSKSGEATPQPGDLEGEVGPIDSSETTRVAVTIDRVRP